MTPRPDWPWPPEDFALGYEPMYGRNPAAAGEAKFLNRSTGAPA